MSDKRNFDATSKATATATATPAATRFRHFVAGNLLRFKLLTASNTIRNFRSAWLPLAISLTLTQTDIQVHMGCLALAGVCLHVCACVSDSFQLIMKIALKIHTYIYACVQKYIEMDSYEDHNDADCRRWITSPQRKCNTKAIFYINISFCQLFL